MKLPRAIFFDWDGTLADSYSFLEQAHNHVRGIFGSPPMAKGEFENYFGQPREFVYTALYGARNEEAKIHFRKFIDANREKLLKPVEGADELMRTAAGLGIVLGVVTNKAPDIVQGEIRQFDWGNLLASMVGAGEARKDKPSGAPLMMAIERAKIKPVLEDIWYVGDTEIDMQCAQDVRCPAVFLTGGRTAPAWLETYKPLLIKEKCTDLTQILLQSRGNSLKSSLPE